MPGLTTKIKERLEHAKEGAKEKINPLSETNKQRRAENNERREEVRKAERESFEKEEIKQASERGKRSAQRHYGNGEAPHRSTVARNAGNFASGTARASERQIFSGFTVAKGYNDLNFGFGGNNPKPKPKPPQRITTISRSGTVKVVETIEKPKPKEPQDMFWDFGVAPISSTNKNRFKREKRIGDL